MCSFKRGFIMSSSLRQIGRNPIFRFGIIGIVLYIILIFNLRTHYTRLRCRGYYNFSGAHHCWHILISIFYGCTVFHRPFLGYGLVGILWALTFPLLFHWSYVKPLYFYEFANDFLFGLLIFMGLSGIQFLLQSDESLP